VPTIVLCWVMFECCFGMCWYANWARLGKFRARSKLKLYKSRPSESILPKRELQSLMCSSGTRISPRRLWTNWATWSLTQARDTHPSEIAKWLGNFERDISPKREVFGFWAMDTLAQARVTRLSEFSKCIGVVLSRLRLSEVCVLFWAKMWLDQATGSRLSEITWCDCCFKLAQARRASLSEAEG